MKMIKIVTFTAAITVTAQVASAQVAHVWDDPHAWWGNHFVYAVNAPAKFTANEFSLDAFGTFTADENNLGDLFETDIRDQSTWGGGVGVNYFLTRQVGIGGDINVPANGGNFVDAMNANLILRFPFETSGLAPYLFGGGGRTTDPAWSWTADAGAGVEYRWNPITAVFTDARYTWADKSAVSDTLEMRAGLRLVF